MQPTDVQTSALDMDATRLRQVEEEAEDARAHAASLMRERSEILRAVTVEVDALVEAAAEGLSDLRAALIPPGHDLCAMEDSARWLADLQVGAPFFLHFLCSVHYSVQLFFSCDECAKL